MRTSEEYNFPDLLNDISGYHLERWNKKTTASGFERYASVDEWKNMALMEVISVKSEKKLHDLTIGIIINVLDRGRVQICLTFKSEYSKGRHTFKGDKSMYKFRMDSLFAKLKCKQWVNYGLVEDGRCWIGVPRAHTSEVPDLLWEIYKNILLYPCDKAYEDVGKKPEPSATSLPDLSFSELDGV